MTPAQRATKLLRSNRFLTLATTSTDNEPWASPINFVIGPNNALHFYSATAATHSQNISETGQVSAAVFPSHGPAEEIDGLQFSASCRPIETSDELAVIHAHYFKVNFKPEELDFWFRPADKFLGNAPQRFYEIDITEAWVYDEERFTNTRIDGRTSVDLNEMWQQLDL